MVGLWRLEIEVWNIQRAGITGRTILSPTLEVPGNKRQWCVMEFWVFIDAVRLQSERPALKISAFSRVSRLFPIPVDETQVLPPETMPIHGR